MAKDNPLPAQAAALPIRDQKICLVTTRSGKGLIIPKGHVPGGIRPAQLAAREAWEEAGLIGRIAAASIWSVYVCEGRPRANRPGISAGSHRFGAGLARTGFPAAALVSAGKRHSARQSHRTANVAGRICRSASWLAGHTAAPQSRLNLKERTTEYGDRKMDQGHRSGDGDHRRGAASSRFATGIVARRSGLRLSGPR